MELIRRGVDVVWTVLVLGCLGKGLMLDPGSPWKPCREPQDQVCILETLAA